MRKATVSASTMTTSQSDRQTDRRGNIAKTEHDKLNRPVKIINPDNGVSTTAYDAVGNITSTTDPIGGTVTAIYDNRNRAVASIDQLGAESRTFYDLAGNPTRHRCRGSRMAPRP